MALARVRVRRPLAPLSRLARTLVVVVVALSALAALATLGGPATATHAAPASGGSCSDTTIDPAYLTTDPSTLIHVHTAQDVANVRASIIQDIWPATGALPSGLPDKVVPNVHNIPLPTGAAYADEFLINMPDQFTATLYLYHPATPTNRVMIWQQGHSPTLGQNGGAGVMSYFLQHGYAVLGSWMPLWGPDVTTLAGVANDGDQNQLATLQTASFNPLELFFDPLAIALNALQQPYPGGAGQPFTEFDMTGVSGGGWTTTLYAAIDPRIRGSYPAAGSYPLYLHQPPCQDGGDWPQGVTTTPAPPALYQMVDYLDLYILGSTGPGRRQVQILNQYDSCCFFGIRYITYENTVKGIVAGLGPGSFQVFLDSSFANIHQESQYALAHVFPPRPIVAPRPQPPSGTLATYAFSKTVTISHALVSGGAALADFPALVDVADPGLRSVANGGAVTNPLGWDIAFADATNTTQLPAELVNYDPVAGQVRAWVSVPSLSPTTDTTLTLDAGDAAVQASQADPAGLWGPGGYAGAWDLDASLTADGSPWRNVARNTGAVPAGDPTRGGATFDGATSVLDVADDASLQMPGQALTLSAWVNVPAWPAPGVYPGLVTKALPPASALPQGGYRLTLDGDAGDGFLFAVDLGGTWATVATSGTYAPGVWHQVVAVYDGAALRLYVDGKPDGVSAASGYVLNVAADLLMGQDGATGAHLAGELAGVQVTNAALSADWVATAYADQSAPATFAMIRPRASAPRRPQAPAGTPTQPGRSASHRRAPSLA